MNDRTRPLGHYGQVEGQSRILLLRGVYEDATTTNRRLKWTGSAYEVTSEIVAYYSKSGTTPLSLAVGEETVVVWRPAAKRYEELAGGAIVFYAYVNQPGWVDNTSATFSFDGAVGQGAPSTGTGTAYNKFSLPLTDNDLVLIVEVSGQYWAQRPGEGSTAEMFVGRLTADLAIAGTSAQAKPIDTSGVVISGDDPVNMLNVGNRWHGFAPYTDGNTAAASHPGSLVSGVRFTDDYNSTGYPGYWITDCEGWAETIVVDLDDVVSTGSAPCNLQDPWRFGVEATGRQPLIESDDYDVTVYDDLDIAGNAIAGDVWLAGYNADAGHYVFLSPVEGSGVVIFLCKTTTDILGTTPFSSAASSFEAVVGDLPTDDPISVANPLKLYIAAGKWVRVIVKNDGTYQAMYAEDHVETYLKAQANYSDSGELAFTVVDGTFTWLEIGPCTGS